MSSSVRQTSTSPIDGDALWGDARQAQKWLWWLAIAASVTSVVLGIMVVAWPDATLLVAAVLFGCWLVVHGVIYIVQAVTGRSQDGGSRALAGVLGVLFVISGILCLRNVLTSLLTIATIVGVTWLIGGIVALVSAFDSQHSGGSRWAVVGLGVLTILGGLTVLVWPGLTLLALTYFTGFSLIAMGIMQFVVVLRTRPTAGG